MASSQGQRQRSKRSPPRLTATRPRKHPRHGGEPPEPQQRPPDNNGGDATGQQGPSLERREQFLRLFVPHNPAAAAQALAAPAFTISEEARRFPIIRRASTNQPQLQAKPTRFPDYLRQREFASGPAYARKVLLAQRRIQCRAWTSLSLDTSREIQRAHAAGIRWLDVDPVEGR
jgi:hypothetical protein